MLLDFVRYADVQGLNEFQDFLQPHVALHKVDGRAQYILYPRYIIIRYLNLGGIDLHLDIERLKSVYNKAHPLSSVE